MDRPAHYEVCNFTGTEHRMSDKNDELVGLATELTVAWLANHNTRVEKDDVPAFLHAVHQALTQLSDAAPFVVQAEEPIHQPAVSIRRSLASREHLLSLIDGKPYRSLRRHLTAHGLTPDEYRRRYGLKPDYPMTAPGYSEARSAMAKQLGLGRKAGTKKSANATAKADAPVRGGRKTAAEAKAAARAHLGGTADGTV